MGCDTGISNYERKKQELINVNRWKSNFLNIWKKYGSFQTINDIECLALYRIDGPGAGQKRMSKHLKQPDLWEKTQNDDIASVSLYFNLNKLLTLTEASIQLWVDDLKNTLDDSLFYKLKYEISDKDVQSHGFYQKGEIQADGSYADDVLVDDDYHTELSSYIAEKKLSELGYDYEGSYTYDEEVDREDIEAMIDTLATYTAGEYGVYLFDVDEVEEAVRGFLTEKGVGTDVLDDFVAKETMTGIGSAATGDKTYYLSYDAAMKMNGHAFVELVSQTLDFRIKKKGGLWRMLKRFAKLILAGVAYYFQQYWVAASLLTGFVADETGIKALKIASQILGMMEGDITSLSNLGVTEAINLLINVYSIYVTLQYNPEDGSAEKEEKDPQKMFYKAPYSAYNDIYCYKDLISVRIGSVM